MGAKRENNPAGENASSSFDWFLADQDREKVDKEEKESKKSSQGIFFCVWTTCYSALNVTILCDRRCTMYLGEDEIGRRKKDSFPLSSCAILCLILLSCFRTLQLRRNCRLPSQLLFIGA